MRSIIGKKLMNKRGQVISIVAFFVIMLSIFILGTLLMSFVNTILQPVGDTLGTISNQFGSAVHEINNSWNKWFDYAIVVLFFLNVIVLLISSYMVDTSPVFLIVYIISVMLLVIFGGNVVSALSSIWDDNGAFGADPIANPTGINSIQYMPITQYLLNHFTLVMLGIIVISGVIMYAKFRSNTNN
jgi:hypothetical protein